MQERDIDIFRRSLQAEAERLKLALPEKILTDLCAYYELLAAWNRRIRMVGSAEPRRAASELFADSLLAGAFADANPAGASTAGASTAGMIDIGAGAGFPGVPIKLAHPGRTLAAVESNAKKIAFIKTLVRRLGLAGVAVHRARAEGLAHDRRFRESFDLAFCRAVAQPAAALELSLPFLRPGGSFVLQAGGSLSQVTGASFARAARELGATISAINGYTLSGLPAERTLILFVKVGSSPPEYPRTLAAMRKNPLA
jgi:16S rRNA (guanine527-N7)-methyltransferase